MSSMLAPPPGNLLVKVKGDIQQLRGVMTRVRAAEMLGGEVIETWVGDDEQHVLLSRADAEGKGVKENVPCEFCYGACLCGDVIVTTGQELATVLPGDAPGGNAGGGK